MTKKVLGFIGSKKGMTKKQNQVVRDFIMGHQEYKSFVHRDCVGSDEDFHQLIRQFRNKSPVIVRQVKECDHADCIANLVIIDEDSISRDKKLIKRSNFIIICLPAMSIEIDISTEILKRKKSHVVVLPNGKTFDLSDIEFEKYK